MCLECDGYSHEAAMQDLDLRIRVNGWTLIQVEDGHTSFCYTVGLVENYDHPELVMMDLAVELQPRYIAPLVHGITTRGRLPNQLLRAMGAQCLEVHDDHLRGDLFGRWFSRYGRCPQPGEVLQVLLPDEAYCECHGPSVRRLDGPGPTPRAPGLNRAE
ncbi:MAG: hypothetical protein RJA49_961, partial [Actinomycetota bacterium]